MNDFLAVLKGEKPNKPPVWLMRQAGRYLPEYRELRATVPNFMTAVLTPEMATEITLQPLRRFPQLDAAILFSDILVIPYALGLDVQFVKGEGPQMPALANEDKPLVFQMDKLDPILQAVTMIRNQLPTDKTLIGFAGSPWTVACYMIAGSNHDEFMDAKHWAFGQPDRLEALLDQVADATIDYLVAQIRAGANAIQLFESWAGLLSGHRTEFERFIIKPTVKIVQALRTAYPDVPIIGFPRQAGAYLPLYAEATGINAVGLGWDVDLVWADSVLPPGFPVQGNLDPSVLVAGGEILETEAKRIITSLSNRPFVFNLGHGVVPQTPPENVAKLMEVIKA